MGFRHAARKDANQTDIVTALRGLGWHVVIMDQPCDLLLAHHRRPKANFLVEVKDGDKPLTPNQKEFHRDWPGQISIIRTLDEAIAWALAEMG